MRYLFLLFSLTSVLHSAANPSPIAVTKITAEKILIITLDEVGTIAVNNDPVGSDQLANYIQERLFKSFLGTGLMHSRIKLEKANANVPDIIAEVVIKEIKEGQKKALISVCLQKYKKTFDSLDEKKQDKLKKQFPVLFQTDF